METVLNKMNQNIIDQFEEWKGDRRDGKEDVKIYFYHHPNIKSVKNYINNFKKVCKNTNGKIESEQKEYKPAVRRGWGKY
jgi:hypothetical protein